MMDRKYALVEVPPESRITKIVETTRIYNFHKYNSATRSKVYRYRRGDDTVKCAIVKLGATVESLKNFSGRLTFPKSTNRSSLESSEEEEEGEESLTTKAKNSRVHLKNNHNFIKRKRVDEIVQKNSTSEATVSKNQRRRQPNDGTDSEGCDEEEHSEHEENSGSYGTEESDIFDSSDEDRQKQRTDSIVKTNTRDENLGNKGAIISDSDNEDENHENAVNNEFMETYDSEAEMLMREKNFAVKKTGGTSCLRPNGTVSELTHVSPAVTVLTSPYISPDRNDVSEAPYVSPDRNRDTLGVSPIRRPTSGNIQRGSFTKLLRKCKQQEVDIKKWKQRALLAEAQLQKKQHQRQPLSNHSGNNIINNRQKEATGNDYLLEDRFHVGDDIYIPSSVNLDATTSGCNQTFVTTMAQAIWGVNTLATRVVRTAENTRTKQELTPRKRELLTRHHITHLKTKNYTLEKFLIEKKQ